MHEVGLAHDLAPDRLSFVESLRLIRAAIPGFQVVDPFHQDWLWQRLLRDTARQPLPPFVFTGVSQQGLNYRAATAKALAVRCDRR
jgi:hypothetical protein